jgi:hypothetical protein
LTETSGGDVTAPEMQLLPKEELDGNEPKPSGTCLSSDNGETAQIAAEGFVSALPVVTDHINSAKINSAKSNGELFDGKLGISTPSLARYRVPIIEDYW